MAKKGPKTKVGKVSLENLLNMGFIKKGGIRGNNSVKIPTGYFDLDFAINFGTLPGASELGSKHKVYDPTKPLGIPLGKLVEVFGPEGGGKSYLCYRIVGAAQKMGYECAWLDTEQSFSEDLALINNVDLDELYLSDLINYKQPDELYFAEDVMEAIIQIMRGGIKVVVLDSVANLVPKEVMESLAGKDNVAKLARLLSQELGKITQWAAATDSLVIFINQIREKIGISFGDPETTPGGRALKHLSSLRLRIEMRKGGGQEHNICLPDPDTGEDRLIGRTSYIRVVKNRFAKPLRNALGQSIPIDVPIYYEPYFPDIEEIIFDAGRQHKIITVYKGEFRYNIVGSKKKISADTRQDFIDNYLKPQEDEPGYTTMLLKQIIEKAEEHNIPLPPEVVQMLREDPLPVDPEVIEPDIVVPDVKKKKQKSKKAKLVESITENLDLMDDAINMDDVDLEESNDEESDPGARET